MLVARCVSALVWANSTIWIVGSTRFLSSSNKAMHSYRVLREALRDPVSFEQLNECCDVWLFAFVKSGMRNVYLLLCWFILLSR